MAQTKFRAIIVGGGPVGLTIANGLDRAGIEFLLVERYPSIVSESGAGIMLWPHTVRIFDQLGLVEACEGRYIALQTKASMHLDGTPMRESPIFKNIADNHGYPCMNFPRPLLLQTLFDGLGASKSKIRTGVTIDDIEMTDNGVSVRLTDGSIEFGSIVIGADGVHSRTRAIMQRLAKDAGDNFAKDEEPIVSNYQIMYGRAKYVPNAETGTFYETHGTYMSSQISADEKRMHFGIYRKLRKPKILVSDTTTSTTTTPDPNKNTTTGVYGDDEVADFTRAFSDVMVMPRLSFTELYANREWTRLVDQPEGLLKRWYHGRVVLAGDSCAVMTSAAGMGVNNGLQSAVALVNALQGMLHHDAYDAQTLESVLDAYQNARREESRALCDMAARMIRVNTWDSYAAWFVGDVVFPWMISDESIMAKVGMGLIRSMRKFDFIEADLKSGKIPWLS